MLAALGGKGSEEETWEVSNDEVKEGRPRALIKRIPIIDLYAHPVKMFSEAGFNCGSKDRRAVTHINAKLLRL